MQDTLFPCPNVDCGYAVDDTDVDSDGKEARVICPDCQFTGPVATLGCAQPVDVDLVSDAKLLWDRIAGPAGFLNTWLAARVDPSNDPVLTCVLCGRDKCDASFRMQASGHTSFVGVHKACRLRRDTTLPRYATGDVADDVDPHLPESATRRYATGDVADDVDPADVREVLEWAWTDATHLPESATKDELCDALKRAVEISDKLIRSKEHAP